MSISELLLFYTNQLPKELLTFTYVHQQNRCFLKIDLKYKTFKNISVKYHIKQTSVLNMITREIKFVSPSGCLYVFILLVLDWFILGHFTRGISNLLDIPLNTITSPVNEVVQFDYMKKKLATPDLHVN